MVDSTSQVSMFTKEEQDIIDFCQLYVRSGAFRFPNASLMQLIAKMSDLLNQETTKPMFIFTTTGNISSFWSDNTKE